MYQNGVSLGTRGVHGLHWYEFRVKLNPNQSYDAGTHSNARFVRSRNSEFFYSTAVWGSPNGKPNTHIVIGLQCKQKRKREKNTL